jgi:hypothetical protein
LREEIKLEKVALISQSNYLPWRGYFSLIRQADVYVIFDTAQFTKRDWRNRNRIRINDKPHWLTIPVKDGGSQSCAINEIQVEDSNWIESHVKKIEEAYRKFPYKTDLDFILDALISLKQVKYLSQVNALLLSCIMNSFDIKAEILNASDFIHSGSASEKLAALAQAVNATQYLTAPAARNYLDHAPFRAHSIDIRYADYAKLPIDERGMITGGEYSIIDLIARVGLSQAAKML